MAQLIQLPFRSGIDEDVDPKQVPPGTLLVGENVRQDKAGRLRKKLGTALVPKALFEGGSLATANRLGSDERATSLFDGTNIRAYSETLSKWKLIDRPSPLSASQTPLIDTVKSAEVVDQATLNGLIVTLYQVSTGTVVSPLYVFVREISTGAVVLPPALVTFTGTCPRVLTYATNGKAYLLWNTTAGTVNVQTLDLATFVLGTVVALAGTTVSASPIDAQIVGASLFLARSLSAGTSRVQVIKYALSDPTFGTSTSVSTTGSNPATAICIDASDGLKVYLAYSTAATTTVLVTIDPSTMGVLVGPTTLFAITCKWIFVASAGSGNILLGFVSLGVTTVPQYTFRTLLYSSAHAPDSATERQTSLLGAVSKPWNVGGRWYCRAMTIQNATLTKTPPDASSVVVEIRIDEVTVNLPTHPQVATLENQTAWASTIPNGHLTQPVVIGTDVYLAASYRNRVFDSFDTANVAVPLGWNQYKLKLGGDNAHRILKLGRIELGVCATPFVFDGASTFPAGFLHQPLISGGGESATAGSLNAGTYLYMAVYVWRDANGVLHRGVPSPPATVQILGTLVSADITVTCTGISGKENEQTGFSTSVASPVMIEIYRTVRNGSDFYKLTLEPLYTFILNDPSVENVTFNDGKDDASIGNALTFVQLTRQPQIYTVSELEDVPPPAAVDGAVHRGRFALIAADRRTVWFSKVVIEDLSLFPGFNEALTLTFDRAKYACISLDERLIVFGENNIDYVEGDGPDSNGDSNTWRTVGMQTDVGCTNPRSVVSTPAGIMFQSSEDIILLGRDLTLQWVGRPVVDQLAAFPTITSAVLCSDEHEVRFTCVASDGLSGVLLAFDYERSAWYVRKYYDADSASTSMPIADAALINGVYTMLLSSGRVYRETYAHALDAGTRYVTQAAEIFVAPAGNQGWSRLKAVQVLGTSVSNHNLTISVARDFSSTFEQTKTFAAQNDVTTIGPLEQAKITLAHQKGQAFRVRVEDASPTSGAVGSGEGFLLEGLGLYVQSKQGPAKTSVGRRG